MAAVRSPDKPVEALREDRLAMLQDIARELEDDVCFPVFFDATVRIGSVLRDPAATPEQVAACVVQDPLVVLKLLREANLPQNNPQGARLYRVDEAIARLGMSATRKLVTACTVEQLAQMKHLSLFEELAGYLWQHSLRTAAIARVLAARLTRVDPEQAFLAGLIHDLGVFYLLDRMWLYPELQERPQSVKYLVIQWHESVSTILLDSLGVSEELVEGVREHDLPRPPLENPRTLSDVIYLANLFAGGLEEFRLQDMPHTAPAELALPKFQALEAEFAAACAEILATP